MSRRKKQYKLHKNKILGKAKIKNDLVSRYIHALKVFMKTSHEQIPMFFQKIFNLIIKERESLKMDMSASRMEVKMYIPTTLTNL